jgi:peptide deformylase
MPVREILLLGNPNLYKVSEKVKKEELKAMNPVVQDLHHTMMDFKKKYGTGRAIAAPQIGVMKRLIYVHITEPTVFINPVLDAVDRDMMELWDDCMSFPDLFVKVKRYCAVRITYRDLAWEQHTAEYHDDMSELLQHEYDHLEGILAVSRALDGTSFCLRSQKHFYME